jgi:3,4-dihydroxy 2-butanone 4-phosphate synthase/GTP cyclohydrolase II
MPSESTEGSPSGDRRFARIEDALDEIARGRVIVVVDDEDRENEGDLVCAAEKVTPELVNFMLKLSGGGEYCVPILPERARDLELEPATSRNTSLHSTAFTVSCDLLKGSTGVSAADKAATTRALADPRVGADAFVRPGHVHPIVAKEGGVLRRAGHTEASVDLCRLAGLQPAGTIIEILDDDGSMARRDRLFEIAAKHGLLVITIEDLIRYRRRHEKLVRRVAEATCRLPTRYGNFTVHGYEVAFETQQPVALVLGDLHGAEAPLVRMHSSCFTGDLLESLRCECGDQLHLALRAIASEGRGVLVYLPQEGRGIGLIEKLKAYALQDKGLDTVDANLALGFRADQRDYGVGIQILKDVGLRRIRLLTNNPKKLDAFIYYGYELEVVDQVPIVAPVNDHNRNYLATKRSRLGHRLPDSSELSATDDLADGSVFRSRHELSGFSQPEVLEPGSGSD